MIGEDLEVINDIFEVSRDEYKSFVETIKPEYRDLKVEDDDENHIAAKIYSKKTGKYLCARIARKPDDEVKEREKYYIFETPDKEESRAPIPTYKLELKTKEEVQKFFDALAKQRKEHQND